MTFKLTHRAFLLPLSILVAAGAYAGPINEPPPVGAILDLNGLPVPHSAYTEYTVDFTGALTSTAITMAFREDPAFVYIEDVSVVDLTTSSGNLLTNGDFSGGTYTDNGNTATPDGWTYANIYGAIDGGGVSTGTACSPNSVTSLSTDCWVDGAVQAYDAISQTIPTNIGDNYQISFWLVDDGSLTNFSDLSTNGDTTDDGGNGADVLVYAQAGLPAAAPEPGTLTLIGLGLAGVGFARVRRRKRP